MDATIESARAEDAQEILDLQKLAYQSEAAIYGEYGIPPLRQTLDEMRVDFQSQAFLKATIGGRIVGSVRGHAGRGTCYIGRLIVHPEFQNQGIGTRLLMEIEKTFGQAERFELFTGHRSERNLYLYRKLGYRPFKSEQATDSLRIVYLEKVIQQASDSSPPGGKTK